MAPAPGLAPVQPGYPGAAYPGGYAPPSGAALGTPFDAYGNPAVQPPALLPPNSGAYPGYGAQGYGAPGYGPAYPGGQPGSLFPNGFSFGDYFTTQPGPYQRFFQNTGMTYTYLGGNGGDEMGLDEIDIHTTAFFPRFLGVDSPLYVTPGFTFDFTDGPSAPVTADVPGALYSAWLDFGWFPRLTPAVGADLNVRVGVYSDFVSVNSDSVRITGVGAADVILTPNLRAKIGVTYLDRVDIKLLPYVGFVYKPHEYAQYDLIFPKPRAAWYLTTVGAHNTAVWWYVGGEYGGGSWSIDRAQAPLAGFADRLDINDIRLFVGLEWICKQGSGARGFAEIGYVFERELEYYLVPADNTSLNDTLMVRAGFAF